MTELQLGLLAIGVVVVAGVFAYNRFQERGARRAAESAFRTAAGDALLEPPPARREAPPQESRAAAGHAAVRAPGALPDARIDYLVELDFAEPRAVASLIEQWKPHEHRYAKRTLLAYSADGTQWQRLAPEDGGTALRLHAGLQLATREGPIGEADLIEFRAAVETLAAATGASVAAPEMRLAVDRARELDQFCADNDIQVVIHLMARPGTEFDELAVGDAAEQAGLALEADDRFKLRDDDDCELFSLAWRDGAGGAEGLSITLDVPRAPGGRGSFHAMARCARQLAAALDGTLVDDNGQVLDERALAAIEAQLGAVQAAFAAKGIEPGSAVARRLFA